MTIKLPWYLAILLMLVFVAAFLCIPVLAFYVLPKAAIWVFNWLIHQLGIRWTCPFNIASWAVAMYVLYLTGVVKFTMTRTKSLIEQAGFPTRKA